MKIEAFLVCWNEREIMPLVVKHYAKFCDKITILDNHSTDGSQELAIKLGCVVIPFGTKFFDDQENMNIKNNCWKGSDADFVIIADFDECLQGVDYKGEMDDIYLQNPLHPIIDAIDDGATIFHTQGWQIMSNEMPKNHLTEITNGYKFDNYSKNICFNPKAIKEINYNPGAHKIDPIGDVVYAKDLLYVLHYKHIGGVQRTIDRYKEYKPRMSKLNRKMGWGIHYNRSEQSIREEWNQRMSISKQLI